MAHMPDSLDRFLDDALLGRIDRREVFRRGAVLGIGAGLLGTILGMVRTFWLFNQGGNYATPAVLAGGMWEALLAAAAGLAVAIPAHLARHFLTGRVRALVHDMEWVGNELMRYLLREHRKAKPDGEAS